MADVASIDIKTAKSLISSIDELKEEIASLKKILTNPRNGTKEWWNREIENGNKDIMNGNYKSFKNAKSLIADLHKLI